MDEQQEQVALDKRVRYYVFDAARETGMPPGSEDIAASLGCGPAAARGALQRLADVHMLVLQKGSGEILMAGPFSAIPTAFPVKSGGKAYYGNCIWDAMGIPAMLKQDATIESSCACCGTAMQLRVREGRLQPATGVVHFALPAGRWWDNVVFT
jgi:hypothetical protein